MNVAGLSIIVMALIAGGTLVAESASAAAPSREYYNANPVSPAPRGPFRCGPKIIAKCPKGQKPACKEHNGTCCKTFGCKPAAR